MTLREWLPLVGITLSAFIFNTSEFMPIGLLTDIAMDFGISEARRPADLHLCLGRHGDVAPAHDPLLTHPADSAQRTACEKAKELGSML